MRASSQIRLNRAFGGTTMRHMHRTWLAILGIWLAISSGGSAWAAQQTPPQTVAVSAIVTVRAKHGKDVPDISHKEDVRAFEGQQRLRVTDWIPLRGSQANLELLILIDESTGQSVANKFDELRHFMSAQPPTTAIAVGYLENGTVRLAQNFTTDHDATGKALRIPQGAGGAGSSPYLAIADALKHWRGSSSRHAIFLISDGIDPLQLGITDTYLDQAIEIAQQAATQITAIYAARASIASRNLRLVNQGQNNLSRLAEASGGEVYFQGRYTPISFAPSLDEFAERLAHQYLLTFQIQPQKKASFRHVKLETEIPDAELSMADRVYVPETQ